MEGKVGIFRVFKKVIAGINISRALVILNRRQRAEYRETGSGERQQLRELDNKRQFKGKSKKKGGATKGERQRERKRGLEGRRVRTAALCHRCSTLQQLGCL